MTKLCTRIYSTRLAPVLVGVDPDGRLRVLRFLSAEDPLGDAELALAPLRAGGRQIVEHARACSAVVGQVRQYVAGRIRSLDVPVAAVGTTFQSQVWRAVAKIPYGRTITYRELATKVGRPSALRAVARANAANPTLLAVPCHRVLASDGRITAYHGGPQVKKALLALEGAALATTAR